MLFSLPFIVNLIMNVRRENTMSLNFGGYLIITLAHFKALGRGAANLTQ